MIYNKRGSQIKWHFKNMYINELYLKFYHIYIYFFHNSRIATWRIANLTLIIYFFKASAQRHQLHIVHLP